MKRFAVVFDDPAAAERLRRVGYDVLEPAEDDAAAAVYAAMIADKVVGGNALVEALREP